MARLDPKTSELPVSPTESDARPRVEWPAPGVARFTVPLALPSPDHLNCHVIEAPEGPLLIDCGTAGAEGYVLAALERAGVSSVAVLVTHGHIDHWGCATSLGPRVWAHPEVEMSLRFARSPSASGDDLTPGDRAAMESAFGGFRRLVTGVPEIIPLHDGQRLGDWEVVWTPGHDPGHVCLWRERDGILLCGDLLLPDFTPNVQPAPGHADTLQEFLDSLARVAALPIELVLPAHGEPYEDAAKRARELARHHRDRLAAIGQMIAAQPRPVEELAHQLFGEIANPSDRMLAAMETLAHLQHLERAGSALSTDEGWQAV